MLGSAPNRGPGATQVVFGLLLALTITSACSRSEPAVTVHHRCGDLNFATMTGNFARVHGGNQLDTSHRIRFATTGGQTTAHYVTARQRFNLGGDRTGAETMTFKEVIPSGLSGRSRGLLATLSKQCRLELQEVWLETNGEVVNIPEGQHQYGTVNSLDRFDYEPCTEVLRLGKAARTTGLPFVASTAPFPVKGDSLDVGHFTDTSVLPSDCEPSIDLYLDGEMEAQNPPIPPPSGGMIHWAFELELRTMGVQEVAMHRLSTCSGTRKLLAVNCALIDVR